MFAALRSRLANSATMIAMVASSSISITKQMPITTYPCIRMRVVGATGENLDTFLSGDVYLNIYTKDDNPSGQLASVNNVVRSLLHNQEADLTTSNIGVQIIREQYVDYPLYEPDTEAYYLGSRYSFSAQTK